MNENKNLGVLRQVVEGFKTANVVIEINLELLGGDIEHKDEHTDILEDVVSLRLKVLLHKAVLTTAIPKR